MIKIVIAVAIVIVAKVIDTINILKSVVAGIIRSFTAIIIAINSVVTGIAKIVVEVVQIIVTVVVVADVVAVGAIEAIAVRVVIAGIRIIKIVLVAVLTTVISYWKTCTKVRQNAAIGAVGFLKSSKLWWTDIGLRLQRLLEISSTAIWRDFKLIIVITESVEGVSAICLMPTNSNLFFTTFKH